MLVLRQLILNVILGAIIFSAPILPSRGGDSFCDKTLEASQFDLTSTTQTEYMSVGQMLVEGRNHFNTNLDYISFASAHYFARDSKNSFYATTSAHVIAKFNEFKKTMPELNLYLSLDDNLNKVLLRVVEVCIHPNYIVTSNEYPAHRFDIALLKLTPLEGPSNTVIPTPLDLREIDLTREGISSLFAVGYGPKGWVGGQYIQFDGAKHGVNIYYSKYLTQYVQQYDEMLHTWSFPLGMEINGESDVQPRSLFQLEGGFCHGMSGGTSFREVQQKLYAVAINSGITEGFAACEVLSKEELYDNLLTARLTGEPVRSLNPVIGQTDLVVPYYVMKTFLVNQMKLWGANDEELGKYFIL